MAGRCIHHSDSKFNNFNNDGHDNSLDGDKNDNNNTNNSESTDSDNDSNDDSCLAPCDVSRSRMLRHLLVTPLFSEFFRACVSAL